MYVSIYLSPPHTPLLLLLIYINICAILLATKPNQNMAFPPLHTKTITTFILLLLCFASFSGLVHGSSSSAKFMGDEGMDMDEEVEVMRELREEMDFVMDYSPPGANGKHEMPPPGKGRP